MKLVAALGALCLVVAACAEDSSSDSSASAPAASSAVTEAPADSSAPAATEAPAGTDATTGTEPPATPPADTTAGSDVQEPEGDFSQEEIDQWGIEYTGATPGEATGEPLTIGYVNQEAVFPENTVGIKAAIEYINTELGGFGGRPGELVECDVNVEEDGTKCGSEMLNNPDVTFVLTGTLLVGNQPLYDVLDGKKPVIIGNAVTTADFLTTAGVGLSHRLRRRDPGHGGVRHRPARSEADERGDHVRRQSGRAGCLRIAAEAGVRSRRHPRHRGRR